MQSWSKARIAAVSCGVSVLVVLNTLPMLTEQLATGLHLSAGKLGLYASSETVALALGSLAAAFGLRHFSPRLMAAGGLAALFCADAVSYFTDSLVGMTAARAAGGLGAGVALGACFYVYGLSHREQTFAAYSIGQTLLALLAVVLFPSVTAALGWRSIFLVFAVLQIPSLLLARHFPTQPVAAPNAGGSREHGVREGGVRAALSPAVRLAIVGVIVFFMGQGSVWTFIDTIGLASGISSSVVNTCLTACTAVGALGSLVVILVGTRVRPLIPLLGSVLLTFGALCILRSPNPWLYGAAICGFYFCLPIFASYQFGVIARADESHRAAVLLSAATFGGFAFAPYLGGQLVERFGYSSLQWLDAVFMTASLATLAPLLRARSAAKAGCAAEFSEVLPADP